MEIDERVTLGNERTKLRSLVMEIYERREYADCWMVCSGDDEPGDCANWLNCDPNCPLRQLGAMAGIEPQADGAIM